MTYFLCSYFDFTPALFYENRVSLTSLKSPICKNTACIDRSGFDLFVKFLYFIVSHIDFGQLPVVRKQRACQWRPLSPLDLALLNKKKEAAAKYFSPLSILSVQIASMQVFHFK